MHVLCTPLLLLKCNELTTMFCLLQYNVKGDHVAFVVLVKSAVEALPHCEVKSFFQSQGHRSITLCVLLFLHLTYLISLFPSVIRSEPRKAPLLDTVAGRATALGSD